MGLQDGPELGPKGVLLVLPRGPCDEVCGLLQETVDHVRGRGIEYQSEFMELPEAEVGFMRNIHLISYSLYILCPELNVSHDFHTTALYKTFDQMFKGWW